jgi:hypothetical protein
MTEPISELISAYLYGHITPEQYEQLRAWLAEDRRHVQEYIREAYLHRSTRLVLQRRQVEMMHADAEGKLTPAPTEDPAELFRKAVENDLKLLEGRKGRLSPREIQELADRKLAAFLEEQRRQELLERRQAGLEPGRLKRFVRTASEAMGDKTSRFALIGAVVVLVVAATTFYLSNQPGLWDLLNPVVASLTDSMDAQWDGSIDKHAALHKGRFKLERGYARLTFQKGADVSIEAPAEFRLDSAKRMVLFSGRLFADVPPSARGFTVDTPCGRVVDLGTQFGVRANSGSSSDVHLFKGKASLTPAGPAGSGKREIMTAGRASRIDVAGQVRSIAVDDKAFVRRFFPKSGFAWRGQAIDLADVVGGGNGFGTGRLGRWLEISTGLDGTRYIVNGQAVQQYQATDNRYHRVTHLPYVDGVFSPDGSAGPVQVSSENHLWQDSPKTAGRYFEDVFNGDHISVGSSSHGFVLNGQAFGTREHPAIALHSNAGISFDLEALRRDMPGLEITEFKALCGVSEDVKMHPEDTQQGKADFWVLVDGKKRFEAIGMDANSKPREISVPLGGQERFVTLVTTDGDRRTNCDWGFFAEPRLEVQAIQ